MGRAIADFPHQPARCAPGTTDATGDVGLHARKSVSAIQSHRNQEPFFELTATGDEFEEALRHAVRTNARSMRDLHDSVRECISSLRADGMQCESALLTMKACIRELNRKHERNGNGGLILTDAMMDQIVRWCITDFYQVE